MATTWRQRALKTIHEEFEKRQKETPYKPMASIMAEIKHLAKEKLVTGYPLQIWKKACIDYENDRRRMQKL